MVIGIANIIPGVSGGTMMVAMGIYDKLIHCITHIFKEFKKSVLFLLPIAVGMVIAVVGSSFGIEMLFEKFPMQTNLLFVGLVIGGLPAIWKKVKGKSIRSGHLLVFLVFQFGKYNFDLGYYFDYEVNEYNNDIMRAVENVNSCWTFPEDMCESRTDWESLRDMVMTANDGISCLVDILGKVTNFYKELQPQINMYALC